MINYLKLKILSSSRGVPQEKEAKFRFAIDPQTIGQLHDTMLPQWRQFM